MTVTSLRLAISYVLLLLLTSAVAVSSSSLLDASSGSVGGTAGVPPAHTSSSGVPLQGAWATLDLAPPARKFAALACSEGELRLVGGVDAQGHVLDDLWRYNVTTLTWQQIFAGGVSHRRRDAGFAVANGREYLYGGIDENSNLLGNIIQYVDESEAWIPTTVLNNPPLARAKHSMIAHDDGGFFVLFGVSEHEMLNDVWFFNATTASWTNLFAESTFVAAAGTAVRPLPRHASCCDTTANAATIICFGGTTVLGDASDLWLFNTSSKKWTTIEPTAGQPWPLARHESICGANDNAFTVALGATVAGEDLSDQWTFDIVSKNGVKDRRHPSR